MNIATLDHVIVSGRRHPAIDHPVSIYELGCSCGQARTGDTWDTALDLMLVHQWIQNQ